MTITDDRETFVPRDMDLKPPFGMVSDVRLKGEKGDTGIQGEPGEIVRTVGRSRVRISPEVLEELIFGYTKNPVMIRSIRMGNMYDRDSIEFEIEGEDVPVGAGEVRALCEIQMNRARQRFVTMRFEPVK